MLSPPRCWRCAGHFLTMIGRLLSNCYYFVVSYREDSSESGEFVTALLWVRCCGHSNFTRGGNIVEDLLLSDRFWSSASFYKTVDIAENLLLSDGLWMLTFSHRGINIVEDLLLSGKSWIQAFSHRAIDIVEELLLLSWLSTSAHFTLF